MLTKVFVYLCRFGPVKRRLWRGWYQFLANHYRDGGWTFMNYGYAPAAGDEPDRYFVELYNFVAGAIDLRGLKVLEVGSGRGGGSSFIKRNLGPASVTGMDFSMNAIELCRRIHRVEGLSFKQGDAEAMPFEDESFDAVVNVESSHCYGSMDAFLSEVYRVLRPGGSFLHADLRDRSGAALWRNQLERSRMTIVRESDITANVLAALDAEHDRKTSLMVKHIPRFLHSPFADFAALRGSIIYEGFRTGDFVYRAYFLKKG